MCLSTGLQGTTATEQRKYECPIYWCWRGCARSLLPLSDRTDWLWAPFYLPTITAGHSPLTKTRVHDYKYWWSMLGITAMIWKHANVRVPHNSIDFPSLLPSLSHTRFLSDFRLPGAPTPFFESQPGFCTMFLAPSNFIAHHVTQLYLPPTLCFAQRNATASVCLLQLTGIAWRALDLQSYHIVSTTTLQFWMLLAKPWPFRSNDAWHLGHYEYRIEIPNSDWESPSSPGLSKSISRPCPIFLPSDPWQILTSWKAHGLRN